MRRPFILVAAGLGLVVSLAACGTVESPRTSPVKVKPTGTETPNVGEAAEPFEENTSSPTPGALTRDIGGEKLKRALLPALKDEITLKAGAGTIASVLETGRPPRDDIPGIPRECGGKLPGSPATWPEAVRRSPAVTAMHRGDIGMFMEVVAYIPTNTPTSIFEQRIPPTCRKMKMNMAGRDVTASIVQMRPNELPDLGNATISGMRMTYDYADSDTPAEIIHLNIRSGSILMKLLVMGQGSQNRTVQTRVPRAWKLAVRSLS